MASSVSNYHVEVHEFGLASNAEECGRPGFGKDLSGLEAYKS
jgi:hypothetical protein